VLTLILAAAAVVFASGWRRDWIGVFGVAVLVLNAALAGWTWRRLPKDSAHV
jgi:protein-S-isoprenylcysteine O-methyltransferase Ste14